MNLKPNLNPGARLALLAAVLLAAAAGAISTQTAAAREERKASDLKLKIDETPTPRDTPLQAGFASVVKEVTPSVVSITTETKPREIQRRIPYDFFPFFREFPGAPDPDRPLMTPRQNGLGSGVIMTEDGYILTNNHVVDGADEIVVVLNPDGRRYQAKVIGRDPKSDIAVVKIDATGLPAIRLGNSDHVEVGDVVLAVGNPFGIGQTVTMGIVGATSRAVFGPAMGLEYEDFIQTDAAINRGNSGGALVDVQGRLIGINTAILSSSGGNNGVGFAVPANLARSVMESIVDHGRVIRGFLGVHIQDVNPSLAGAVGLKNAAGAVVAEVNKGSPADQAGLKVYDVITRFDGRDVRDSRHLKLMVGQTPPDKEVAIAFLRDGKPRDVDVRIKELPDDPSLAAGRRGAGGDRGSDIGGLRGVVVGDLTPQWRQRLSIPRTVEGALVTEVDEESVAWDSGLRQGDVIQEINRKPVRNAEEAIEAVQDLEQTSILLRVWRGGSNLILGVDESNVSRN